MIATLLLILIVAAIVSVTPMNPVLKNAVYIIIAIEVLSVILPLVGVHIR